MPKQAITADSESWPGATSAKGHKIYLFTCGGFPYRFCPVKLDVKRISLQLAHTWTIARTAGTKLSEVIVVQLTGADGTVGLGEASPIARYKDSVRPSRPS